jgi:hypothetical protein
VLARQRSAVALCAHAYRMDHPNIMLEYESRKNINPERIIYLRKLIVDQDANNAFTFNNNASTPNTNVFLSIKRGPGRPKNFKNKKTEF